MSQHSVVKAMLGGLLGTLLQTMMVYGVAPMMLGQPMDLAAMLEHSCAPGMLMHLLSGSMIFPLGYVFLLSQRLPGSPVLKGTLWGALIWFVTEVIITPMLGAEIFSAELGGLSAAMRALLGYLVYGATLGGIASAVEPEGRYVSHAV